MAVAEQIQARETLYIGGQWVAPADSEQIEIHNPATEQVIGHVPAGTPEDVERAVEAAAAAFPGWAATPLARRVELLAARGQARRALRRGQIFRRAPPGLRGLEQHPQHSCIRIGRAAIGIRVRCRHDALGPRLVGQKARHEVIDGAQCGILLPRDGISEVVSLHVSMIPEQLPWASALRHDYLGQQVMEFFHFLPLREMS